jgi:putative redox protein
MKVVVTNINEYFLKSETETGNITYFDAPINSGGKNAAPSPMEVVLGSIASCSAVDIISILKKKRKTIQEFKIEVEAERAEEHPKVYTKIHLKFILKSQDALLNDLERSVELSMDKYCSVSAMIKNSGCEFSRECILLN